MMGKTAIRKAAKRATNQVTESDHQVAELTRQLKAFSPGIAKDCSFSALGALVEALGKAQGTAARHYGVKMSQKAGGYAGGHR